ncbi:aldo/keto reductase [Mycobacterium kyorinense]|uniref:Alcohol dehydrogenase n=1 Tax=Mycobacterium kyorinense TaxID=487514 RepID=A0A1X1YAY4_9MYCO|nr:aldo/keto reductase [Mycobacterium kyorinense]ORW08170.1 alcohol dehydrogenase [Mycobacterium kyorinense]
MRYNKLGNTGLDVSPVAIGAMSYGEPDRGYPAWSLNEDTSRTLIKHALEAGINFFDTANYYSLGNSEEILGRALSDFADRDDVVICTKVCSPMRQAPNGQGLSRKAIMTEIDASLRRLGTDYVDIYMIHRFDTHTPIEETLEALHDVVKAGKARYLGASSMRAFEFAKALHLQTRYNWARFITMQDQYNLLAREEEREMLPLCADEGVGTMVWSPLARGRLARPAETTATARSHADPGLQLFYSEQTATSDRAIIDAVGDIANSRGVSRAAIALAWLHHHPVVAAPLVGANSTAQIDDAVTSVEITLSADELDRLQQPYTPRADVQALNSESPEVRRLNAQSSHSAA